MNIQDVRKRIAVELEAVKPDGWSISAETRPAIHSGLIHVGHVTDIVETTFCSQSFNLFVTLWVNEGNTTTAADSLYALVSGPDSIQAKWREATTLNPGSPVVETVGLTPEGPTRFLAAVIRIPMTISSD